MIVAYVVQASSLYLGNVALVEPLIALELVFALPFAYVGAVLATHGIPSASKLAWITLAVLGARTSAMAANRFIDRNIDVIEFQLRGNFARQLAVADQLVFGNLDGEAAKISTVRQR